MGAVEFQPHPFSMQTLLEEIEKLSEYLVHNRACTAEEIEFFYQFCYGVMVKARQRGCHLNPDLEKQFIEEDITKVNLAFHGMVYESQRNNS